MSLGLLTQTRQLTWYGSLVVKDQVGSSKAAPETATLKTMTSILFG